ncbi:Hsp20 family protein [Candidatus Tachikawaea gelatinosa]|uniref:Small heat shock protein IbpA n=1 Tax=Candidatus Tachikawaea gelatinosa TaxID=1410383 RepID=A0A090BWF0_9ENTR|nr:Hsp20 family protein [Candidatus Tachikawaea gelatinosa]BAP58491.1 small heat shock protein IbpA [Candidatus Tachikawaea gelatinosa]
MMYRPLSIIPELTDNLFSDRFEKIDKLFSKLTGDVPLSDSPLYNLIKNDETHYELVVSVPGYQESDLNISLKNNQLTIIGKNEDIVESEKESNKKWLHQGIKKNSFHLDFNLNNKIKVQSASLHLGLLKLLLEYEIPEEEKPKKITINTCESKDNRRKNVEYSQ